VLKNPVYLKVRDTGMAYGSQPIYLKIGEGVLVPLNPSQVWQKRRFQNSGMYVFPENEDTSPSSERSVDLNGEDGDRLEASRKPPIGTTGSSWYGFVQWSEEDLCLKATLSGDVPAGISPELVVNVARFRSVSSTASALAIGKSRNWLGCYNTVTEAVQAANSATGAVLALDQMAVVFRAEDYPEITVDEFLRRCEEHMEAIPF
jgi:hypothetical protein